MISLQVAFPESTEPDGSTLYFGIATTHGISKIVSGVRAVEQHFTKLLLTDPGSDVFNPEFGAGLLSITRKPVTPENTLIIRNELALAIMEAQTQIIDSQVGLDLDDSEILVSAEIQELKPVEEQGWVVTVRLIMADGNAAQVLLGG